MSTRVLSGQASEPISKEPPAPAVHTQAPPIRHDVSRASAEATARVPNRMQATPDLLQTDPDLRLPGGGASHCAPVAVSNSLMFLAANGFPRLISGEGDPRDQQIVMVRELGSAAAMATNRYSGTGPPGVLLGTSRYVKSRGYRIERLRYQGWRGHPPVYSTHVRRPTLEFIDGGLRPGSATFLHVGWYRRVPRTRASYLRNGGHWLTVVGRGADHGLADDVFVVHDPAPYAGTEPSSVAVRFTPLEEGWIMAEGGRIAFKGAGYFRLAGGMHVKREGEIAILDGVIVLEISDPDST